MKSWDIKLFCYIYLLSILNCPLKMLSYQFNKVDSKSQTNSKLKTKILSKELIVSIVFINLPKTNKI